MKRNNKKGFTVVELVIVIAVIAILAAVLIPTFSNVIKKANESSDIQAMKNMNTYLAIEDASKGSMDINDVYTVLKEQGLNAKDYKPLYDGRLYFYDQNDNRIVYTDMDYKILFGENEGKTNKDLGHQWYSLNGEIKKTQVTITGGTANVSTAEELYWLLSDVNGENATTVNITSNIDLMGADISLEMLESKDLTIDGRNKTLSGICNVKYKDTENKDGQTKHYHSGLIPELKGSVTIKDLTIKDSVFGSLETSQVALIGKMAQDASAIFDNVTIENCKFIGTNKVSTFVGWVQGGNTIEIKDNCHLKNVEAISVEGQAGKLIAQVTNNNNVLTIPVGFDKNNMENVTISYVESEGRTIYRGTVALGSSNDNSFASTYTNELTKLDGLVTKKGKTTEARVLNDSQLFGVYTIGATFTLNGCIYDAPNGNHATYFVVKNASGSEITPNEMMCVSEAFYSFDTIPDIDSTKYTDSSVHITPENLASFVK